MTPTQLEILRSEIKDDPAKLGYAELGDDYPAIAALLNQRDEIENPTPQGQTPKRLSVLADMFTAILPAEAFGLLSVPGLLDRIERAVEQNNRPAMTALFTIISFQLTQGSRNAITSKLAETEPDPAWSPTVTQPSRAEALGLPVVSEHDVQAVLA